MHSPLLYSRKANGKLLLTGEYFVLDGAQSLACPTQYGQTMEVKSSDQFSWKSYDDKNEIWIEIEDKKKPAASGETLLRILQSISTFEFKNNFEIKMDFPRDWGLGSSSTFIALLADYMQVNPYTLNQEIFKGSGYDIACAFSETPILYSNINKMAPDIRAIKIPAEVKPYCYFAYTNTKQDSREGIAHYRTVEKEKGVLIQEISSLTHNLILAKDFHEWIYLLEKHEHIIASSLHLQRAADTTLKNFPYFTKSLGAWGGDFVLIISDDTPENIKKNLSLYEIHSVFNYQEILLG